MPNRGLACAAYVPVPGLAWLCARAAPGDRLVRFHAMQAGPLAALAWLLLLAVGLARSAAGMQEASPGIAGTILALALVGILVGIGAAARGLFLRLRPLWDLGAALSRLASGSRPRRSPPS